jgi:GntR family transcriptional regulator
MQIHVSPDDGLPVYKQIFNQIKYLVASGVLAHGEELPPIRALAEQLLINPNTVARAYRELEHAGIVVKRGTVGTFVSDAPSPFARRERLRVLRQRIDTLLADASHMGVSLQELKDMLDERDALMRADRKNKGAVNER